MQLKFGPGFQQLSILTFISTTLRKSGSYVIEDGPPNVKLPLKLLLLILLQLFGLQETRLDTTTKIFSGNQIHLWWF